MSYLIELYFLGVRVFVDVVNGEYVPRKSILKSRSRENSVCSDTSESSTADFDDRRALLRGISCEEATCSDTGESIQEEEQPDHHQRRLLPSSGTPEVCVCVSLTLSFM